MRLLSASSERRRCLSVRHWTGDAAFRAAPMILSFTSDMPTGWRRKSAVESIAKVQLPKFASPPSAAIFCIKVKTLPFHCAVHKIRQSLIFQAN
jgi:hypothetical protein